MTFESMHAALASAEEATLAIAGARPAALRMYPRETPEDEWGISMYYAPFDFVNRNAELVLIGITPGESQMRRAWSAALLAMKRNSNMAAAVSEIKRLSAFNDKKGQMRPNLYAQLEHWGVHRWLGVSSGASLFADGWPRIHTTSLLKFPTFLRGKNYEGKSPAMLKHEFLRSVVFERLVPELRSIPNALLLPLGATVEAVVRAVITAGDISNRCAYGMLHPSGNNTYRLKYLCGNRSGPLPHATSVGAYDVGRRAFQSMYLQSSAR